jgi:hypothetical protein
MLTVIFIHCSVRPTDKATAHYALPIMPRLQPRAENKVYRARTFICLWGPGIDSKE